MIDSVMKATYSYIVWMYSVVLRNTSIHFRNILSSLISKPSTPALRSLPRAVYFPLDPRDVLLDARVGVRALRQGLYFLLPAFSGKPTTTLKPTHSLHRLKLYRNGTCCRTTPSSVPSRTISLSSKSSQSVGSYSQPNSPA